jgi:calcineurin-like phosphoesterase family protein
MARMSADGETMIFFTSDHHFNHDAIIQHGKRRFVNLDHMAQSFIANWNSVVTPACTVYHLGDFALSWGGKHKSVIDGILSQLNGSKHLIIGNHDRKEVSGNPRWCSVQHYKELKIDLGGVHKQRIVLSHYPLRSWNQMHRGAWMLHGHSHGNLEDIGGKIMDVGVDTHTLYGLYSLEDVQRIMSTREFVAQDHHE